MKDSLLSVDLFRRESIILKTHWVLVVMDQFTRPIVGLGVHPPQFLLARGMTRIALFVFQVPATSIRCPL